MPVAASRWRQQARSLLHAGLPQACTLCAAPAGTVLVCAACADSLPRLAACCPRCAVAVPGGGVCGQCLAAPPAFDRTRAVFSYDFPVDRMIQAFKYQGALALAGWFAEAMLDAHGADTDADLIVPLPLARARQRERGYNQALEIARPLARGTGIRLAPDLLRRVRETPPQAGLPLSLRARNLRGAFDCVRTIPGARVIVVDDVMTTGASLDAAARALKAAGAASVANWLVARTPPPGA